MEKHGINRSKIQSDYNRVRTEPYTLLLEPQVVLTLKNGILHTVKRHTKIP